MTPDVYFTLLYLLISVCFIYPPTEFVSIGLTIPALFKSVLGSEDEDFVLYNVKRTTLTLFIYSFIPLGYILGLLLFVFEEQVILLALLQQSMFWQIFLTSSIGFPLVALYYVASYKRDNWSNHPIAVGLSKFCNNNCNWQNVASNINIEYRRVDKFCLQSNAITKIVATENWIIKATPLMLFAAHQSDASLVVKKAETHFISVNNASEAQYLTIEVKSSRNGIHPFTLRINALDFKDLQDRLVRNITVLPNVKFHKTVLEQFIDAFKESVKENELYVNNQEIEQCIGCLQNAPNVKIQRLCSNEEGNDACGTCYCRPMWCVDCLGRWFASRQNPEEPYTWLSSKCTCPMCRAKFCILDVCMLQNN